MHGSEVVLSKEKDLLNVLNVKSDADLKLLFYELARHVPTPATVSSIMAGLVLIFTYPLSVLAGLLGNHET